MQAFHFNQPNMIGISVCCYPAPLNFYVHTSGGDVPPYPSGPGLSTWTYVPFAEGERINAIWMRSRRFLDVELGLLLKTSHNKCIFLGAHAIRTPGNLGWSLVATPMGRPASFYFNLHWSGARELVFNGPVIPQLVPAILPRPFSPYPRSTSYETFMWSYALLDCVASLRPCRQRRLEVEVVSGLVLQYEDGTTTTVGEVRLDCMGDRIAIDSACVWLGFLATEGFPCVTAIEVTQPANDTLTWFEVPMTGRLEWWYTVRQLQVWHDGRTSMSVLQ